MDEHIPWMKEAIGEALKAEAIREVPIGAVVVHQGQILAAAIIYAKQP